MKPLGLLLLCLSFAGCIPPYLEDLNRAAALTRQMTVAGTLGPLNVSAAAIQSGVRFLPTKPTVSSIEALNLQSGFLVAENAGFQTLSFASMDSSGEAQTMGSIGFPLAGADPNYPLYQYDVTTTTATANMIVFNLNPTNSALRSSTMYTATLPNGPLASPVSELLGSIIPTYNVLGVNVTPNPGSPDTFCFLIQSGATFGDGSALADMAFASVFKAGTVVDLNGSLSVPVSSPLYFRDQARSLGYANYFQSGQWICKQWAAATAPVFLTGVTHRLDAVLTNGDLLSTEGEILRLYDPSGTGRETLSVPLNGLRFCYEAYIGSTPYVFFSLAIRLPHDHLAFNVYAIPTSSMRSLGG